MSDVIDIPYGSVLGLNYNGMHDSAIAVVAPDGAPVFATALERVSRVKQDGRPPFALVEDLPWDRISEVAVSTEEAFIWPANHESRLLPTRLPQPRTAGLQHAPAFYSFLEQLPCKKTFVCHQLAHAASAFWGSGLNDALCLVYDGGMMNCAWFGALYGANRREGIAPLDRFSALHYAKVTSLYTFVTALLGFMPNKHEGKITGLAAFGTPTDACRALLTKWFEEEFMAIESVMEWVFAHDPVQPPFLLTDEAKIQPFRDTAKAFSREELAATVQEFAEKHVLTLLSRARDLGWRSDNICLAGGLFANVKINQRVADTGFSNLFIAPPMTDDGTALGAAWDVLSRRPEFAPPRLQSMSLGPSYSDDTVRHLLEAEEINFSAPGDAAREVANLLAGGAVVAVFQGNMEFGPRALGNRSILARPTRHQINRSLNERLRRTEFMPFAPVSRAEDADECYVDIGRVAHAAEFMTVTVSCTENMKLTCPAVVHVDGTARPQLVSRQGNPFIHAVLSNYGASTGEKAVVNTSFNIHEEPIVRSPEDALQGFLESGLDYLILNNKFLIASADNEKAALRQLRKRLAQENPQLDILRNISRLQSQTILHKETELAKKESVIHEIDKEAVVREKEAVAREAVVQEISAKLNEYRAVLSLPPIRWSIYFVKRIWSMSRPRLGFLSQYVPRPLTRHRLAKPIEIVGPVPKISLITPSYQQGRFIEGTILSVLQQGYPNLEYHVQDGGSQDETVEVLKRYEDRLSSWMSEADSGQSEAINRAFARTSGEIMSWLNSDDLLLPNVLATVAEYFRLHPEVDVVYGNRLQINDKGLEIGRWILPGHDSRVLSWADYVPQETLFWRRRIWDKVGGRIDESFRFAMDWDLLVRFRDAGARFAHIPIFLGAFRVHDLQKTSSSIEEIGHQEMNRIRQRTLGRIPTQKEVHRAIGLFLLKHLLVDVVYRIRVRVAPTK